MVSGCWPDQTPTILYPPDDYKISDYSEFTYDYDRDLTWKLLLKKISKDSYRIDRSELNLQRIIVSLAGQPSLYIDCGKKSFH